MASRLDQSNEILIYLPDEKPNHGTSLLHGFQSVMGRMAAMAATASIVAVAGGQSESYLSWILFAAFVVCGLGGIFQTVQIWRFGSGYSLSVISASAFIAICISALQAGGPAMLSTLMVVASLVQFIFVANLSLLRRIITPVVTGTVLMLLAATVIPVVLDRLSDLPEGSPSVAAPVLAGMTLVILLGMRLFATAKVQQWAPVAAILSGCICAIIWGIYDFQRVEEALWIGIPAIEWPGFDLSFGSTFWSLLPGL